jgi:phosphomannomutase
LIHYLNKYKGYGGKVVVSFTVSNRVKKLCEAYGLPIEVTKVGFKYICEIMINEDVLVGGEESGGIAIKGHIPERDGVWNALVLMEYMAKSGKSLTELIDEVYQVTGPFDFDRYDLHITEELKQRIVKKCTEGAYNSFGHFNVQRIETIDGWKYHFDEESWVMIRASGTEPVLRVYSESSTTEKVREILDTVKAILLAE